VDENLDSETIAWLRDQGWNAKTVEEFGLKGQPDENILAFAQRDDRILLTHDDDFLDDQRFPLHRNPGVVVLPGASGNVELLVRALLHMLAVVAPYRELFRGTKVVFATDGTLTVTQREHDSGRITRNRYKLAKNAGPFEWVDE
jgi:predicted nuclease of predicted toxin-antitoxin system